MKSERKPLSERNVALLAAHEAGKSMRAIGKELGISGARVHQIIKRERERAKEAT